jgi:hypothetical protein
MPTRRKGRGGARKGAGRPRKSKLHAKSNYINIRIKQETRRRLDAEARRRGNSRSGTAERMLEIGLRVSSQTPKNRNLESLLFLIGLLAQGIPGPGYATTKKYVADPRYNWRTSPFMFKAFRVAVMDLLDSFQPTGEIIAPPDEPLSPSLSAHIAGPVIHRILFPVLDNPERRGHEVATKLLSDVMVASMKTTLVDGGILPSLSEILDEEIIAEEYGTKFAGAAVRAHAALSDVVRDLGWPQESVAAAAAAIDLASSRGVHRDLSHEKSEKRK